MSRPDVPPVPPGTRLVVTAERVAHGGHVVARHEGRVLFVRHALPGETVEVVVTGAGRRGSFLRADTVRVLTASADRVVPPCRHAADCGGCDWQHVRVEAQRELKAEVLREQLARLGGLADIAGEPLGTAVSVRAVPGDAEGLGWRTRERWAVDPQGRPGLRRHRSHEVVPVDHCPLVTEQVDSVGVGGRDWSGADEVLVVASSTGERAVLVTPSSLAAGLPVDVVVPGRGGRTWVRERAAGRDWRVRIDGFWQVHPGAADALVAAVRDALAPRAGEHLLDLYSGVGLFAGSLAADLGPGARIDAVEASTSACSDARRNLHDLPQVHIHEGDVARWLHSSSAPASADLVVLDPPRTGAGRAVLEAVLDRSPRAVAYVACDPAALGRDVAVARERGWRVGSVVGLDLFPMTHHVEAVCLLLPS